MKSFFKNTWLIAVASLFFINCRKDLALSPISSLSINNFFQSETDVDKALGGVYNKLLSFPDVNNIYLSEARSNNYYVARQDAARDYFIIAGFEVTSQLGTLGAAWRNDYELIARANQILENIDKITFADSSRKNKIKGECRFLRALSYFELVKVFGGVPLVTHPVTSSEALKYPRISLDTIYNFIIGEFTYASTVLPATYTGLDVGRATKWAALGLLGRVYMYTAGFPLNKTTNYELAKNVLKSVLDAENIGWKFATNYRDIFKEINDNKFNVFEVQYQSGGLGLGSVIPGEVIPNDMDRKITPYGQYFMGGEPSSDLIISFEPGDLRKSVTLDTIYRNILGAKISRRYFKKFLDSASASSILNNADWPINFPILRGEDVMLMYAEAVNETNGGPNQEALTLVNRIRKRAGLNAIDILSKQDFRIALEKERRSEFAWEGLYWYDLIRTGRVLEVKNQYLQSNYPGKVMTVNQIIYPIPRSEMLIQPGLYFQNPGYD